MSTDGKDTAGDGRVGGKSMAVLDALRAVTAPGQDQDIVTLGWVQALAITGASVRFALALPPELAGKAGGLKLQAQQALEELDWVEAVEIGEAQLASSPPPAAAPAHAHQEAPQAQPDDPLPGVRHVIAVGSGKGGVGKSTVSVNLALALAGEGYRVGILDADVYGPSIPLMLGARGQPMVTPEERIIPSEAHGLKMISMGLLLREDQAVVWRGPMVHGVVKQFVSDVEWGELDYLIVDLPPGTGDAPLSLAQLLPLTAAVVVTTPQEIAAAVAQKAMHMFLRMGLRILGVIENMSYFVCPHCNESSDIFDRGGGRVLAGNAQVPFLGEIPIDMRMRKGSDVGAPVVVEFPDSELAQQFREVAQRLAHQVEAPGTQSAGA
jgi:ATP-binding protein involved in chromosome partitioning